MHLPALLTALTLTPLAQSISLPSTWWTNRAAAPEALGHAIVTNNCADPIYVWSVGGSAGAQTTIKPQHAYTEPYRVDDQTGGVALKITTESNGLYSNAPQLILAYALDLQTQRLYYDLSEKFGSPFRGHDVRLFAQGAGGRGTGGGGGGHYLEEWRAAAGDEGFGAGSAEGFEFDCLLLGVL
jgi:hypothetical protein